MSDQTITTTAGLAEAGLIAQDSAGSLSDVQARYAIAISPAIAKNINPHNPDDPLARQFIPSVEELHILEQELLDPISDEPFTPVKGIVHRYPDRALLKLVNICPVYCRFCFRREMVGPSQGLGLTDDEVEKALAYVRQHPSITELIMTGGDPLVLSPRRIAVLTSRISSIKSITKIRWHTRLPMVMPDKVTDELITALSATKQRVRIAIHANHPNEFSADAIAACEKLRVAGFGLLSQSVLLKGINDDIPSLSQLMQKYAEVGVRAYYLHHGDLAPGTSHFRTTISHGLSLMKGLRDVLPASLCPNYILDVPGGSGKIALTDRTCTQQEDGRYVIQCRDGSVVSYSDVV